MRDSTNAAANAIEWHVSPAWRSHPDYTDRERASIGLEQEAFTRAFISQCPSYAPTPLHRLPALAASLGLAEVMLKEEGQRFGMQSFKALGGAYAVALAIEDAQRDAPGDPVNLLSLARGTGRALTRDLVFCCASDGNHGRSVAFGAAHFGAKAVIFVHEGVSEDRCAAMARLGAQVKVVPGTYDDSVREAGLAASANGWTLVSDTSAAGGADMALRVMRGYAVLIAEACQQAFDAGTRFTHVLVQAGVGGLAAAVAGYCADRFGGDAPALIVVEPNMAACLLESARAGEAVAIPGDLETVMAMLSCGEPSPLAWDILKERADAFITITDDLAEEAVRRFYRPLGDDPSLLVGESGAAGLGALIGISQNSAARSALQLGKTARVLIIGTEAPTDLGVFERIVSEGA